MRPFHSEESNHRDPEQLHQPVLLQEVLQFLQPHAGGFYVDATTGLGGHAEAILRASDPNGKLLGIDQDVDALALATARLRHFQGRFQLVCSNFSQLSELAVQRKIERCDGILFDLGVSSLQLDLAERGFSFQKDGPLDMRMDKDLSITADEIVNYYPEKDLATIIYQYGEEPLSRRIARAIVRARPVHGTQKLAQVIARAVRLPGHRRIHPATRTFQALRIFVNDELSRLAQVLRVAIELLAPAGRIVVISFHSLEDRIVKETFRTFSRGCICPTEFPQCTCGSQKLLKILTRHPLQADAQEILRNPRARSAKLRAAEKL